MVCIAAIVGCSVPTPSPSSAREGRGGRLMKGQVISSCSSGHIAGDGGDQIDSPLQSSHSPAVVHVC